MRLLLVSVLCLFSLQSFAGQATGLVINATEIGVGKFHRMDNKVHKYEATNAWAPSVLPENASPDQTPVVFTNSNGSYSVQFSSLEELLTTIVTISKQTGLKVAALNVNGHGLPGAMWFPKDAAQLRSRQCADWRESAAAPDEANYNQYYSPVSKQDIMMIRAMADSNQHFSCTTGLPEWQEIVAKVAGAKEAFDSHATVHFLSCVVGLGQRGVDFTIGVAEVLGLKDGMVQTSLNFGLGDWSMPEGMGFWDYITDEQLERDNEAYPINKRDRDMMQPGTIRMSHFMNGQYMSVTVPSVQFMSLEPLKLQSFEPQKGFVTTTGFVASGVEIRGKEKWSPMEVGARVRIPGTGTYTSAER